MKMQDVPEELSEARLMASIQLPYMANLTLGMQPVVRPGLGTLAVDQYGRMYYDPAFLKKRPTWHNAYVVNHEGMHIFLAHCKRLKGDDINPKRAAIAVDLAVNTILNGSGLRCPDEAHTPGEYNLPEDLTAEEYYAMLQHADDGKVPGGGGEGGETGENGEVQGGNGIDSEPGEGEPKHGSNHDGKPKEWEEPAPSDNPGDDETPGMNQLDIDLARDHIARKIKEYSQTRGTVPGSLLREAMDVINPTVDPVKQIRAKVKYTLASTAGFGDYTYRRPNRRTPPGGCILPSHRRPLPTVLVIADTSGSMGDDDLGLALGTIARVLKGLPDPRGVEVWAGDAALACAQKVFRPEQVSLAGGGGTDMGALIEQAARERRSVNTLLVVTDGDTEYCPPVGKTVLICLTRSGYLKNVPKYFDVCELNPERTW